MGATRCAKLLLKEKQRSVLLLFIKKKMGDISTNSHYFNTIVRFFSQEAPHVFVQPNPVILHTLDIEAFETKRDPQPVRLTKTSVDFTQVKRSQTPAKGRELMLVQIFRDKIVQYGMKQQNITRLNQHFVLLIVEGDDCFIFDPAEQNDHAQQISRLVAGLMLHHNIYTLEHHPQRLVGDLYCMAYICMIAAMVLIHPEMSLEHIVEATFPGGTAESSNHESEAKIFAEDMAKKIPGLGPLPMGSDVGEWAERHKGALATGAASGIVFGPWGLFGGLVGGDLLFDRDRR